MNALFSRAVTRYWILKRNVSRLQHLNIFLSRDQEDREAVGFVLGNKLRRHSKVSRYMCVTRTCWRVSSHCPNFKQRDKRQRAEKKKKRMYTDLSLFLSLSSFPLLPLSPYIINNNKTHTHTYMCINKYAAFKFEFWDEPIYTICII